MEAAVITSVTFTYMFEGLISTGPSTSSTAAPNPNAASASAIPLLPYE